MQLELGRDFLEVMKKEMELRGQDLVLRKESQAHAHEYALAALQAQSSDRKDDRGFRRGMAMQNRFFAGFVILGLFILSGFALAYGKEAIVLEALKDIALLGGGLCGGAFWGYRKAQREAIDPAGTNPKDIEGS